MPVTITAFSATKQKETILLKWDATYETNFKLYEIERSIDGNNYLKIGTIEGKNLGNYYFLDKNLPSQAIVYYRLKMIDIDGSFRNSKTVVVKLNSNFYNAIVYPNPTMGLLNIKLTDAITSNTNIKVTDITGRLVMQQKIAKGQLSIDMDVHSLPSGRYFIKINDLQSVINQSFVIIK